MGLRNRVNALVLLVVFATASLFVALPAIAGNGQPDPHQFQTTRLSVPSGYNAGTLSYGFGKFAATNSNGNVLVTNSGNQSWNNLGFSGKNPVVTSNQGVAYYTNQGMPAKWDGNTETILSSTTFSTPFIQPACSANGDIAFGNYMADFLLISRPNGTTEGFMPFNSLGWPGGWWTVSAAFVPGGTLYVSGQNTVISQNSGYRVVRKSGSFTPGDTGMSYSQIMYGGGRLWGLSYDHSSIDAWNLYGDGSVCHVDYRVATNGYFNLLGADDQGLVFKDDSSIYRISETVPEPGSMLAMLSGMVGLIGYGFKRRR